MRGVSLDVAANDLGGRFAAASWNVAARRIFAGIAALGWLACVAIHDRCHAQPVPVSKNLVSPETESQGTGGQTSPSGPWDERQVRQSVQWLADLAVGQLPGVYRGDKDWGEKKKVWAGVDVKRDGWRLKTHRRYREVNHGRWFRYEVFPQPLHGVVPPAPPTLASEDVPEARTTWSTRPLVQIHEVRRGSDQWTIHASVISAARFTTQLQRWNLGMKWYSISTEGRLQVQLDTVLTVKLSADYRELPPALVLDPRMQSAELTLQRFDLDRVSHVGGEVAEEIGVVVERNLKRFWMDDLNEKLVSKLNRSIDKRRDQLRWSLGSLLSQ